MPVFKFTRLWTIAFKLFHSGDTGAFEGGQQALGPSLRPKQLEVETLGKFPSGGSLLRGDLAGCDPGDPSPTHSSPQRLLRVGKGSGRDKPCSSHSQVAHDSSGITAN